MKKNAFNWLIPVIVRRIPKTKTIFIVLSKRHSYRVEERRRNERSEIYPSCGSRGMMRKKKTGNHIRTHMNFGRTLTRYSLRIFVFHFSFFFFFLSKQSMKMLQCLSWKFCETLCFSWPKHRPTWKHFNCFQQNIDIIFNYFQCYFFNVIINTSIWEAKTKFVHLLRNKFSSNTHYIFKNKLRKHITNISKHHLPEWQINSIIYADVAF